ncbi:MAG TPA: hypothetical protein VHO24_17605 [Opitutaceae bacterium]|nr:hypothetical protein [Opitutaceae bacterium]
MHFKSGPSTGKSLPEPLAPRSESDSLKTRAGRHSFDRQSGIRPEVVARARTLAADPDYPSFAVIRHIAREILVSTDGSLHED